MTLDAERSFGSSPAAHGTQPAAHGAQPAPHGVQPAAHAAQPSTHAAPAAGGAVASTQPQGPGPQSPPGTVHPPLSEAHRPHRGVYLLPNAFTLGCLFCGFYAIVQAMNGNFGGAAVAIFVAMLLDGMDGRVARLTGTQSEFGAQFDSLADMVSFGAAPALIVYEWSLRGLGKLGWLAAFVYVAGAALRLARFNTNVGVVDKRYFQGMPSPTAAALVAGLVWIMTDWREAQLVDVTGADLKWVAWVVTLYAGVTMVSSAPFYSFKDLSLKKRVPFVSMVGILLVFVLVSFDPPLVLFSMFLVYGVSGYALWLWRWRTGRPLPWRMPPELADEIDDH